MSNLCKVTAITLGPLQISRSFRRTAEPCKPNLTMRDQTDTERLNELCIEKSRAN